MRLNGKLKKKKIMILIYYIYSKNDTIKQYVAFIEGTHPYFVSIVLQLDAYGISKNDKYINDFKNIIKSFKNMPYFKLEEKK